VILSKALTSQSKVVRFLATRHMRVLLRAGVANFSAWGIEFLVKQLSDTDSKVRHRTLAARTRKCQQT
jgi:rapamycin-insensitive companion of mTOR